MRVLIPVLSLLLAACAAPSPATDGAAAPATDVATRLTQHHWRLEQATDASGARIASLFARAERPLQLDFADGRLTVSNACNRLGATYALQDGRLQLGPIMATRRACAEPALAALDDAIGARLGADRLAIEGSADRPVLVLVTPTGDTLRFVGTATPQARHGEAGAVVFLEVAAETLPCHLQGGQCLQVRELHYDAQGLRSGAPGPWHELAQPIEGFEHQPGVRNVLRVRRFGPADAPAELVLELVVESDAS